MARIGITHLLGLGFRIKTVGPVLCGAVAASRCTVLCGAVADSRCTDSLVWRCCS